MIVKAIKTEKVTVGSIGLFGFLDKYVSKLTEGSILVITSKVVAICEGRVLPIEGTDKDELIKQEADMYLPKEENKYNLFLTIKNSILAVSAGIDESNVEDGYLLWPENPQKTAGEVREYLKKRFNLKKVGVIITDSKTTPLRWGVTAIGIGYSGFSPLKDYIGTPDIFGRKFRFEKLSHLDSLSSAAGVVMGEGNEQTPLAVISDIPFVEFIDRNPTDEELNELAIDIETDVYAPILKGVKWLKPLKSYNYPLTRKAR